MGKYISRERERERDRERETVRDGKQEQKIKGHFYMFWLQEKVKCILSI